MKAMLSRTEKIHPQTSHKIRADKKLREWARTIQNFCSLTMSRDYTLEGIYQDFYLIVMIEKQTLENVE